MRNRVKFMRTIQRKVIDALHLSPEANRKVY